MIHSEAHLAHLLSRRSVRDFDPRPIAREVLERLVSAAITAPSPTNRQPWRFAVVESPEKKALIAAAIEEQATEMKRIIKQGHHAEDFGNYGDFFHEPIERASVVIIPQFRIYPDLIANFIASGGGDPDLYNTAKAMQSELCATSAAVMALLLQAHAEGVSSCWMSGPMIARDRIAEIIGIKSPWKMIGAVALGYPTPEVVSPKPRKPLDDVVQWV